MEEKEHMPKEGVSSKKNNIHHKSHTKAMVWVLILLLIITNLVSFIYQTHKIDTLNHKNTSLSAIDISLKTEDKNLTTRNTNLNKAYKALQNTFSTGTFSANSVNPAMPNSTAETPTPVATLTVNSVQIEPKSYFGVTDPSLSGTDLLAVSVSVKNLTSVDQTYAAPDFAAITNTGELDTALVFGDYAPGDGNFWNNSTVVPGGTMTQTITFNIGDNLTSLQFTPTNSQPIIVPLPAASSN